MLVNKDLRMTRLQEIIVMVINDDALEYYLHHHSILLTDPKFSAMARINCASFY